MILFLVWSHFASAETGVKLDQLVGRIESLSCDLALSRTATPTIDISAAAQIASELMSVLPVEATSDEIGPIFVRSFHRLMSVRPLKDPPYVEGSYPHLLAVEKLDRRIREMAGGIRSRRQAAAVAFAVAGVYADINYDAEMRRKQAKRMTDEAAERLAAPASEADFVRTLDALANELEEAIPPRVRARLKEHSIRLFLAHEILLLRDLIEKPDEPRPRHYVISRADRRLYVEALQGRLRNDFRLLDLPEERDLHGTELIQLRHAVEKLGPELALTMGADTFHAFDLATNEIIVTDAIASTRLRKLLMNRIPALDILPPLDRDLEYSGNRRRRRDAAPVPFERPVDTRSPRLSGLAWYVTHLRPEFLWAASDEIVEAHDGAEARRLELGPDDVIAACREIRRGGFDPWDYFKWAEAAEHCVRVPKPVPRPALPPPPPTGPSHARRAARAVIPNVVALGLSFIYAR